MRKLKFRAWDVDHYIENCMVVDDEDIIEFDEGNGYYEITSVSCVEQYTGLKDNNGKEIYEGDIVEFSIPHFDKSTLGYDGETDLVGKIEFDYDRFDIKDKDGVSYDLYSAEQGEVIGNIHENPELLGGEK